MVAITKLNETELDCRLRLISLQYAQTLQDRPDSVWQDIYNALELGSKCAIATPSSRRQVTTSSKLRQTRSKADRQTIQDGCDKSFCIYAVPSETAGRLKDPRDGSLTRPYLFIEHALAKARAIGDPYNTTILLREGIHSLKDTIKLGPTDSGLSIKGYPGEQAWISGSLKIPESTEWSWDCNVNLKVKVANLTNLLRGRQVPIFASLFAPNKRLIRARYPNGDPELDQWGYRSPGKYKYSIRADEVVEWHRPPPGEVPDFQFVDLSRPPPGVPVKNDSAQTDFNSYASGSGGVCADLWGSQADSYWCSNASSGGWAEVDRERAVTGQLQIPVGMTYNRTSDLGQRLDSNSKRYPAGLVGGVIHCWHSQSWAMHMFEISQHTQGEFKFVPGGGRQGARNWCRCDQCTYAAHWCGQYLNPPVDDKRLIGGTWLIENVLSELDMPGEFFFNTESKLLYVYPNSTQQDPSGLKQLRFAVLERLVHIEDGAKDVSFSGIGFRETALTYVRGEYSPPSGGDWSIHRDGAIFIENATNISISDCIFQRLDGNALFVSKRTTEISILNSVFEWIGESTVVLWGDIDGYDGTGKVFPMDTLIQGNIFRELGIFQKQSSAVAHNKAVRTTIQYNIMYNMARAAVNFNDMMGGGDKVEANVIFNTCRESGDHGPINSWDRQPFMTDVWETGKPSFVPKRREISRNMIIANFGASEGVDNDDGSSWYGGHDSIYEDNLVISYPVRPRRHGGSRCVNFEYFLPNHGHVVRRNRCIVPNSNLSPLIELAVCKNGHQILQNNAYFTPGGTASIKCGYSEESSTSLFNFSEAQSLFELETGSKVLETPSSVEQIEVWVWDTLQKPMGNIQLDS